MFEMDDKALCDQMTYCKPPVMTPLTLSLVIFHADGLVFTVVFTTRHSICVFFPIYFYCDKLHITQNLPS